MNNVTHCLNSLRKLEKETKNVMALRKTQRKNAQIIAEFNLNWEEQCRVWNAQSKEVA